MATYKTPGVYVQEISTLPPSVAEVSTAVPAFIGYTQIGPATGSPPVVRRINTMLEYEEAFGGANPTEFTVSVGDDSVAISKTNADAQRDWLMYYCLRMYFKNGGGSCYIISVGNYDATPGKADFEAGLAALAKEDEPTLILLTDAVNLDATAYYDLCGQSLAQCGKLKDRFTIIDVLNNDKTGTVFREQSLTNLKYGAAYYPYLQTTLSYVYADSGVNVTGPAAAPRAASKTFRGVFAGLTVTYKGNEGDTPQVQITAGDGDDTTFEFTEDALKLKISDVKSGDEASAAKVINAWSAKRVADSTFAANFQLQQPDPTDDDVRTTGAQTESLDAVSTPDAADADTLAGLQATDTAAYSRIKTELAKERIILPPSSAMAGIYARVDRERGVWKAPANVNVASVIGPTVKITQDDQDNLNVDPQSGKSINAIRSFAGKGTLVWGARTLAGNDNEWRYINVRRLFNMIEESTQKATAFAVFEGNDATTWLKVKGMIESFLYGLWEQGALAGAAPEAAYFVNVGLGKTMTSQDVLEGRMIVEMGIAAVRPAEFIILRFSHKLQEA